MRYEKDTDANPNMALCINTLPVQCLYYKKKVGIQSRKYSGILEDYKIDLTLMC